MIEIIKTAVIGIAVGMANVILEFPAEPWR